MLNLTPKPNYNDGICTMNIKFMVYTAMVYPTLVYTSSAWDPHVQNTTIGMVMIRLFYREFYSLILKVRIKIETNS